MNATEYEHLLHIALLEKVRAVAAAEQRYRERIQALRQTKELSEIKEQGVPDNTPLLRHGDVTARVRYSLRHMPESFIFRDLARTVRGDDAPATLISPKAISSAIKRLVGTEVELVEKGKGKRGNRYRKLTPANAEVL